MKLLSVFQYKVLLHSQVVLCRAPLFCPLAINILLCSSIVNIIYFLKEERKIKLNSFLSFICLLQFEYDDWLATECGYPAVEEWRKLMYMAACKNRKARPESYRDEWDDDHLVAQAHEDFKKFFR